jgi:hypothetical protein
VGELLYTVRVGSLDGQVLGRYKHPGPEEPQLGTLLSSEGGLEGGPWRVCEYAQTDESAPAKNVLIVAQIEA